MGNTCTCFQKSSSNKEIATADFDQKCSESTKDPEISKFLSEQEEEGISTSAKMNFQSIARGYLHRKHIGVFLKETRESEGGQSSKLLALFLDKSMAKQANTLFSEFPIPSSFSEPPSITLPDGTIYAGKKDDSGNRVNFGISLLPNGAVEAGFYIDNALEDGRIINPDGSLYQGQFCAGGHGVYICPKGNKFEGTVENGLPNGFGTVTYKDDSIYEGSLKDGKREGSGRLVWPNGDCYIGEFSSDQRHGQGRMAWHNLEYYEGEWQSDSITGIGEFSYLNGDLYEGTFANGLRHGPGSLLRHDGIVHECTWKDDKEDGEGKVILIQEDNEEIKLAVWVDGIKV